MNDQYIVRDLATEDDYNILQRLSVGKRCAFEFGSFVGGSAIAMLPQIKEAGGKLYCIDHFYGNEDDEATQTLPRDLTVATFIQRVDPYRGHVVLIVGETKEAYSFPPGVADLVFIDATHSYHGVLHDIHAALHLLKPGGLICGHDYIKHYEECNSDLMDQYSETPSGGHGGIGYGVIRAVHEVFGRPEHEGAIWWKELP